MRARIVGPSLGVVTAALIGASTCAHAADGVVVIGHAGLNAVDQPTLEKIYTGRVVELNGVALRPVNAATGNAVRGRFLQAYLRQDEDKYTAYWVVRRYVGKGTSPREMTSNAEIIRFVNATPGAIGYIDETAVEPGLNVLMR